MSAVKVQQSKQLLKTIQDIARLLANCDGSIVQRRATYLQFRALDAIEHTPSLSVGEVANQLHISKSSATQLVERLVAGELVVRETDSKDKRSVQLRLTAIGKEKHTSYAHQFHKKCLFSLSHLSGKDIQHLLRINSKLLEKLQQSLKTS